MKVFKWIISIVLFIVLFLVISYCAYRGWLDVMWDWLTTHWFKFLAKPEAAEAIAIII